MGRAYAEGIAETEMPLEQQIAWHLQANHYPPVPTTMVEPCVKAIQLANTGDWDKTVELPSPITWRGLTYAPVREIIGQHHLETWVEEGDDL